MLLRLFLLFTLVPLLELFLLLRIGQWIGAAPTLALVLASGAAGAWLARREGLRSWRAVRAELRAGGVPGSELVHGVLILVAGVVLVTPGVVTDALGLLLLLRPVRRRLIRALRRRFQAGLLGGVTILGGPGFGAPGSGSAGRREGGPGADPRERPDEKEEEVLRRSADGAAEWRRPRRNDRADEARRAEAAEAGEDEERRAPRVIDL